VNPLGETQNCVNCVVAGDATLNRAPAVVLDSARAQPISVLERMYGGTFKPVAGRAEIERTPTSAGAGARGIVFRSRGPNVPGHVFNAVNQRGAVNFVDFQTGGGASFAGYESFYFLRTG